MLVQIASGYTSLMLASASFNKHSNIETIKILIDAGADVDIKENNGLTALSMATHDLRAVKILIDAGSDVNVKDKDNNTFLMLLLRKNLECCADLIIQLLHLSKKTLLDTNDHGQTSYDHYMRQGFNILDEYNLKILKGYISLNSTNSDKLS